MATKNWWFSFVRWLSGFYLIIGPASDVFRIPPDAIHSVVQCIYDFAHRHRSPMVYAIEGMPKPHLVQLPSGEEIEIRLSR